MKLYGYFVVYVKKTKMEFGTVNITTTRKIKTYSDIVEVGEHADEDVFVLYYKRIKVSREDKKNYWDRLK